MRIVLALFIFLLFRPGFAAPSSQANDADTSATVEASEPASSNSSGQDDLEPRALAGKRAGMPFTKQGKTTVKQKNAEQNDGKHRCENCGVDTVPGQQHKKGVTPPDNEAQVDHVIPRAKGGDGDPENGQVLWTSCMICGALDGGRVFKTVHGLE